MAGSIIFTNAYIRLSTSTGGVVLGTTATSEGTGMTDISAYVSRLRLTREMDEHDDTVMGMTAHSRVPGLESWGMELEMLQEFDATATLNVDNLLSSILDSKARVYLAVRPYKPVGTTSSGGARGTSNPEYYGTVRLFSHTPMDGGTGDLLKTAPSFRSAGNLTRLTTATSTFGASW